MHETGSVGLGRVGKLLDETNGTTPAVSQHSFEWILHSDAEGRRRARAHVSRGVRKEKAAQAQAQRQNASAGVKSLSNRSQTAVSLERVVVAVQQRGANSLSPAGDVIERTIFHRAVGSTRSDPFSSFPIQMDEAAHTLLDHYFFGLVPTSGNYVAQPRAHMQPLRSIIFRVALPVTSSFHMLLSGSAMSVAEKSKQPISEVGIRHHGTAIKLVNESITRPDASDSNMSTVAMLAGYELLYGTPKGFTIHMDGLATLMKMRGGMRALKYSSHQLYSLVAWMDYAGSCEAFSKRRFCPVKYDPAPLFSSTDGMPEEIIQATTQPHDTLRDIAAVFQGLYLLTLVIYKGTSEGHHVLESRSFVSRISEELTECLSTPIQEGIRTRRRHILRALNTLALIYTVLVAGYEGVLAELLLYRLEKIFSGEHTELGAATTSIFRSLLTGEALNHDDLSRQIAKFFGVCTPLTWESWSSVSIALLDFLVHDPSCEGDLQNLWKRKVTAIRDERVVAAS